MKNKLVKILLCLVVYFAVNAALNKAYSQKLFFIFAHLRYDAASLDKSTSNRYNYGIGAEGGVGIGAKNTFFTGTIGYTSFHSTNDNLTGGNLRYIPLKAGVRYYLPLPVKIVFVNADLGVGFLSTKDAGTSSTRFAGDAGAGVKLANFEVMLSLDGINEPEPLGWATWFNIKAGWRIGL